ncbi:hypothetical protein SAMN05444392_11165 [Seinonella peptonophila]|uniref:Lipoprotein n=1 Tax=Seinonella peptonophila TaxID=112248 RepID=A0A1M4ZZH8_9BACL|nr:hypothetical protein [Seinonella peptonophila]SHF23408.1 hypothetical protein SAMN05444392_11165 [Seinonella peptonophila]
MKRLLGVLLGVCLLAGCAWDLDGTWILSSGQDSKGCTKRFTFLEKGNVEVENDGEMPFVVSYERVGANQYKMDTKTSSNLISFKIEGKKLQAKISGGTATCLYDQINS